jgi:diaminohydroxyphosphoribosylaminopyrimidine deaminase/5-amino-6-(5-phosphoribosylamino)uracil reductase
VAGKGFAKLRAAGIDVSTGLLAEEGRVLNARFFTFFEQKRPYIILKWAVTADGFMGGVGATPVAISGPLSGRLVHRWRSEEDAILVGTTTARHDNPCLNVRHWPGKSPVRIVLDRSLSLPPDLHLFDGSQPTSIYHQATAAPPENRPNVSYAPADSLEAMLTDLHQQRIQSVLVEGGAQTLTAFLEADLWDEIRLFRSPASLNAGVLAPQASGRLIDQQAVGDDTLFYYQPVA